MINDGNVFASFAYTSLNIVILSINNGLYLF
jgi:hypothetical protein